MVHFQFDVFKMMNKQADNYSLARKYHQLNCVDKISINKYDNEYEMVGVIDINHLEYHIQIYSDLKGKIKDMVCDCGHSAKDNPCAHIGALLLKLNEVRINTFPYHYQRLKQTSLFNKFFKQDNEVKDQVNESVSLPTQITDDFIQRNKNQFVHHSLMHVNTEIYSLYPEVIYERNQYLLQYRIGNTDKQYIIKSIASLLDCYESGKIYYYGKNMRIHHNYESFDDFSNQQFLFLKRVSTLPTKVGVYAYELKELGRHIHLHPIKTSLLPEFFDTYKNYECESFKVKEKQTPISFLRSERGGHYILTMKESYISLENNTMYYLPNEVSIPYVFQYKELDNYGKVNELIRLIHENKEKSLYISKEQWNDFDKYVLQPIASYIEIENYESQSYMKNMAIYADLTEDGEIIANLVCTDNEGNRFNGLENVSDLDYKGELVKTIMKQYATQIKDGIAYFDSDNESTVSFFNEGVLKLHDYCDIFISDALKKINQKVKYNITLGVKLKNDLLSLDIKSLDIPRSELSQVLLKYRRRKKYHRLKNGELISLRSHDIENLDILLKDNHIDIKDLDKDEIILSPYRMFELDTYDNDQNDVKLMKDHSFSEFVDKFRHIDSKDIVIPSHYDNIFRDYQKEGYRWLYKMHEYNLMGILADDMGLGKTLQVISILDTFKDNGCSLVVCPSSLVYNWEDEIRKFAPGLKVGIIAGNKKQRQVMIHQASHYDVLVTSYDYLRRDEEFYKGILFHYVVLDEAQYIKNQRTKNAIAVKALNSTHRLALTGTPIENTLAELWSIFDFLMPGYLYNYQYFKKVYETPIIRNNDGDASHKLKQMVSPFILRRNKKDVLLELPKKIEQVVSVGFEEKENELYLAHHANANEQLQALLKMDKVDKIAILSLLMRLRMLCIEPRLVYEDINETSSKMKALLELIENAISSNQKILVFSSFPSVFPYIEKELIERRITFLELTGSDNSKEKKEIVNIFQEGNTDVLLISLKAGGIGLNLTKASVVIHIDPWWNMSVMNQATDRAYRIGQDQNVHVYKLIMKGSIEEKILDLQHKKQDLSNMFVENNDISLSKMSREDIINLFKD